MPKKLKVLLSAYACEPHKGSEPEVGWQWALQMSRHHEVTVLTRANNRPNIERELAALGGGPPSLRFVYHDLSPLFLRMKKHLRAVRTYYILWQQTAHKLVQRLHQATPFDLLHHVTIAGFRYPTAIWDQGVPTVWGPIGGVENIPWPLLAWKHPASLVPEAYRNLTNHFHTARFSKLPQRARRTTVTLVSTNEMLQACQRLGLSATLMPTIGLPKPAPIQRAPRSPSAPLQLLFVGNVIMLKGIDLALEALKQSGLNAIFTIIGDGQFLPAIQALTQRLGLTSQVIFRGRLPRQETLKVYPAFDLFIFPSLHDTGGYAVIEAMAAGLPVICLDCGGPKVAVSEGAGSRIPLGSRQQIIRGLAEAFRRYDRDRPLLAQHGQRAWEMVCREYDWNLKGEQLDAIYQKAVQGG